MTASVTTWADVQSNEEAQYQKYAQNSSEYNLKMANIYKNLAVTGAEARVQKDLMCEEGTYTSDIVSASVTAIIRASYSSPADAEKMSAELVANTDVQSVGSSSFSFREATIYATPHANTTSYIEKLRKVIVGTKFWGPGLGAYGSQTSVEFLSSTEAKLGTLKLLNQEPWSNWTYKTVKYTLEEIADGGETVIVVDGVRYTMQKDWLWSQGGAYILIPEGTQPEADGYYIPAYVEYQSECEA